MNKSRQKIMHINVLSTVRPIFNGRQQKVYCTCTWKPSGFAFNVSDFDVKNKGFHPSSTISGRIPPDKEHIVSCRPVSLFLQFTCHIGTVSWSKEVVILVWKMSSGISVIRLHIIDRSFNQNTKTLGGCSTTFCLIFSFFFFPVYVGLLTQDPYIVPGGVPGNLYGC